MPFSSLPTITRPTDMIRQLKTWQKKLSPLLKTVQTDRAGRDLDWPDLAIGDGGFFCD